MRTAVLAVVCCLLAYLPATSGPLSGPASQAGSRTAVDLRAAPVGAAAVPALAVPRAVGDVPLPGWSPWAACPGTSRQNCAEVRAIATVAGGTTYLGGSFTHLVSPDGERVRRTNLAALLPGGDPAPGVAAVEPNGTVLSLATDGATVYVGGAFTAVDGSPAANLARLEASTGRRLAFSARTDGPVHALAVSGPRLYAGGRFASAHATPRAGLAAFDATSGALDPAWAPAAQLVAGDAYPNDRPHNNVPVRSIDVDERSGRVYVAGDFDLLNGLPRALVAAVDLVRGTTDASFTLPATVGRTFQGFSVVAVEGDGARRPGVVLAAGGVVNAGFRFDLDGTVAWRVLVDGDVQAAAVLGDTVYLGGHFTTVCLTDCYSGDPQAFVPRMHIAAFADATGTNPAPDAWAPRLGPSASPYFYGVWALAATDRELLVGGVFAGVGSGATEYPWAKFTRFAVEGP